MVDWSMRTGTDRRADRARPNPSYPFFVREHGNVGPLTAGLGSQTDDRHPQTLRGHDLRVGPAFMPPPVLPLSTFYFLIFYFLGRVSARP